MSCYVKVDQNEVDTDLNFVVYNLVLSNPNGDGRINEKQLIDWFEKNNLKVNPECIKKELNFLADLCLIRNDSSDGYEIV